MRLFALDENEALEAAGRYGTPCFAYSLGMAKARYLQLRAALPERCHLAYAVKANPGAPLLALFAGQGSWFDCASSGELSRALAALGPARAATGDMVVSANGTTSEGEGAKTGRSRSAQGNRGKRILFAGPGKNDEDIRAALAAGARLQIDGPDDLERIKTLGDAALGDSALGDSGRPPLEVNLRVHPGAGISEGSRIIGGTGPSAFGVDEEDLADFLRLAKEYPRIRIAGLQVFAASNEKSHRALLQNHRASLEIGQRMHREFGLRLDLIDLGGGLGIPYSAEEEELDIQALGTGLGQLLNEHSWFKGELVLEPGRWLAGPCGVYLARVSRTKLSRGVRFAVLEGGINHLLRPLLTGQPFPALAPGASGEPVCQTLAGPLCTSLDRLGEAQLPELRRGDLVMLGQTGAYGFTEAMNDFLCRPRPQEIWLP